ncbi:MAG TPA: hypothetical protein DC057_02375 [Spirochaetia bacterium]|nr:hypothetical protein [Spirochaetia bacterium]
MISYEKVKPKMKTPINYELDYSSMWENWQNITHPNVPDWVYNIWKRFCCKYGWHLFDEVGSPSGHMLSCDACGLSIRIDDNKYLEDTFEYWMDNFE